MNRFLKHLAVSLWWLIAVCVISVALLLGVARLILPSVADYRSNVEGWLSDYLEQRVEVESLDLRWRGFGPQLTLRGLQVADAASGSVMFGVNQAYVDTDLWNLLLGRQGVVRDIELAGFALQLDVRRDGSIALQDTELWRPGQPGAGEIPGDVMAVFAVPRRISLSDVSIRVFDERRRITHRLDNISVQLENIDSRHRLHLDVPLPIALGERVTANLDVVGEPGAPQSWAVRLYAMLQGVQLHNWTALWHDTPLQLAAGTVDGELWMEWTGSSLRGAHARTAVRNLTLQARSAEGSLQRWRAVELSGDWRYRRDTDGWVADVEGLRLREENGRLWPATRGHVEFRAGAAQTSLQGEWSYLKLDDVAGWLPLAQAAGLDEAGVQRAAALRPRGEVHDVRFLLPLTGGGSPALRARLERLQVAANGEFPGVAGLSGNLQFAAGTGRLELRSDAFSLDYPRVFRYPLELQRLVGDIGFNVVDGVEFWSPHIEVVNQDLASVTRMHVQWREEQPLFLDLQADFHDGNGSAAARYLPVGIMPQALTDWLSASIVDGRVTRGSALVYGPAMRFPFRAGDGVFQVDFGVRDGVLQYQPDWPALEGLTGNVRFAQAGLEVNASAGSIHGAALQQGWGRFVDLETGVLEVRGRAAGDMARSLSFIRASPLQERLGPFFEGATGTGQNAVSVELNLPILDLPAFQVAGTVALQDAGLRIDAWQVDLEGLKGVVAFTGESLTIDDLNGRLRGRPVQIRARPRNDGTRFVVDGEFSATELLGDQLPQLTTMLDGRTGWRLQVDLPAAVGGDVTLNAKSSLRGVAVNLPAPLLKPVGRAASFETRVTFLRGGEALRVAFRYARLLTADLALERNRQGDFVLERGVAKSGEQPARLEEQQQGLRVSIEATAVDLDGWLAFAQALPGEGDALEVLQNFELRAQQVLFNRRPAGPLTATVYRRPGSWVVGLRNPSLSGSLDWPLNARSRRPLQITLQKLDLGLFRSADGAAVETPPVRLRPTRLPPLRIAINALHWQDMRIDDVRVSTTPHASYLSIDELSFDNGALQLTGKGDWREADDGAQYSRVEFRIESNDWGEGLTRLGYAQTLRQGEGHLSGELSWRGPVYGPALDSLRGTVRVHINKGTLIGADPGLGRIVGLFSLQALPRRLALDFKDFLADGFDFDRIRGTVELADGLAYTREMQMRGTVGKVQITGRSNLLEQTYAQEVLVIPNLSASLPLAGEIVVPGSGVTVLLLGALLKGIGFDVERLGQLKYTLTGPWSDPVFEKVVAQVQESESSEEIDRR